MTLDEMAANARLADAAGTNLTLVLPRPWKNRPKGFPRGELLCENFEGTCAYSFNPLKILAWVKANASNTTGEPRK